MATKKVYLVDTENVGSTWKNLLPAKAGSDQILLFFTENSPYVSYSDLQLILQFPDRFEMIRCYPGKNGLDFQLVSYLGYLLKTASKSNYVIVSNDNGFDAVVKFWQERGMSISRMNVHRALQPNTAQVNEAAAPAKQEAPKGKGKKEAAPAKKKKETPADTAEMLPDSAIISENSAEHGVEETEEAQSIKTDMAAPQGNETENIFVADSDETADSPDNENGEPADLSANNPADTSAGNAESEADETNEPADASAGSTSADTAKTSADAVPESVSDAAADTGTEEPSTPADYAAKADSDAAEKPAPKRKRGRPPKSAAQQKTAAPTGEAKQPSAEKPAPAQRRKTSAAQEKTAPAVPDSETMELDFSNLTVSEKAALVHKYLPDEFSGNSESLEIISDIMFGHDTTNHHLLHLAFVKSFGDEKGTRLYKAFRPHLAEFRA